MFSFAAMPTTSLIVKVLTAVKAQVLHLASCIAQRGYVGRWMLDAVSMMNDFRLKTGNTHAKIRRHSERVIPFFP